MIRGCGRRAEPADKDPSQDADEQYDEQPLGEGVPGGAGVLRGYVPVFLLGFLTPSPAGKPTPLALGDIRVPPLALLGELESILHATTPLQDILIIGIIVALADDVGGAELELGRERGLARPLDVLGGVGAALVRAADHLGRVEGADGFFGDALDLRDGGQPAGCGEGGGAEG